MITDSQRNLLAIVGELQPAVIQDLMARDGRARRAITASLKRLRDGDLIAVEIQKQRGGNWKWWYSLTRRGARILGIEKEKNYKSDPFWAAVDRAIASRERRE